MIVGVGKGNRYLAPFGEIGKKCEETGSSLHRQIDMAVDRHRKRASYEETAGSNFQKLRPSLSI